MNQDQIVEIIRSAYDEVSPSFRRSRPEKFDLSIPLLGQDSPFDSLLFVSFMVVIEEKISDVTGLAVTIVDDSAFSSKNSPFRTMSSLVEYVGQKVK